MSLNAASIRMMADKGLSASDIAEIAEAMEVRVDRTGAERAFVGLIQAHDIPPELAGAALLEVAVAVVQPETTDRRRNDDYTGARDSNRARRGMSDHEWRRLRQRIFERDEFKCQYCYCIPSDLTCDHIIPLVRGGTNDPVNLTAACRSCNSSKGDKLLSEWSPL